MGSPSALIDLDVVRALGNKKRLLILEWLKDPVTHFPPHRDSDLVHGKKIKQWVSFQRDERRIRQAK